MSTFAKDLTEALAPAINSRLLRIAMLTFYYMVILLGLVLLYGKGDFSNPPFVYQGF